MYSIQAGSLNEILLKAIHLIIDHGKIVGSRSGTAVEVTDVEIILENPRARHLYLAGRTNNIYSAFAELIWVFSGSDRIDGFLGYLLPRAKDYSDDGGKTWRGAYGPRLYQNNQIYSLITSFMKEGLLTKRAVFSVWRPDADSQEAIEQQGYPNGSKDIPCSQWGNFWVRDNLLFMKFFIRANDVIFGLSHINIVEWTFLQEIVLFILQTLFPDPKISLGYYHHSVTSLHIYQSTLEQAKKIISLNENVDLSARDTFPLVLPKFSEFSKDYMNKIQHLFFDISKVYDETIAQLTPSHISKPIDQLKAVFSKYDIPIEENILFSYAFLPLLYLFNKKMKENGCDASFIREKLTSIYREHQHLFPKDILSAIQGCTFTPWAVQ